jgi:rhomboid family protein
VLPLSDGLPARRFPVVNVALIAANTAVWIFYELPDLGAAVAHASFYPCDVDRTCQAPLPWPISWLTAIFMHASWSHLLGNMLFLAIFGKNVEDAFGRLRYLAFYVAGGLAATALQTAMTLLFSSDAGARIPMLGASGAISAVLGAFLALYPHARIKTLVLVFFVQIPAWAYLGGWFLYQLLEAHNALFATSAEESGVAFFAHVGGFVFGWVLAGAMFRAGRIRPQSVPRRCRSEGPRPTPRSMPLRPGERSSSGRRSAAYGPRRSGSPRGCALSPQARWSSPSRSSSSSGAPERRPRSRAGCAARRRRHVPRSRPAAPAPCRRGSRRSRPRRGDDPRRRPGEPCSGVALAESGSYALLASIVVSNLPEAFGGAAQMREGPPWRASSRCVTAALLAAALVAGRVAADTASEHSGHADRVRGRRRARLARRLGDA